MHRTVIAKKVPHDLALETILVEVTESKEGFLDFPLLTKPGMQTTQHIKLTVCMIMPLESLLSQCGKYLIGKFTLGESTGYSTIMILEKIVNLPRRPVSFSY